LFATFAHINREILKIALLAIVANITVPLLGLVDTAFAEHLRGQIFIGAVAVGSMMLNLIDCSASKGAKMSHFTLFLPIFPLALAYDCKLH